MTPALAALISRVEAGEVGEALDADIAIYRWPEGNIRKIGGEWWSDFDGNRIGISITPYSTSIDAQAALGRRIVWAELVDVCPDQWRARARDVDILGVGPTEAAARLAALLRGMDQ